MRRMSKEALNRLIHKFKLYLQTGHLPFECAECNITPSMSPQINKGYNVMICLGPRTKTRPRQDSLCLGKPRQNQDKTNSVLEKPRQNQDKTCLGFVLSWIQDRLFLSCLGLVLV